VRAKFALVQLNAECCMHGGIPIKRALFLYDGMLKRFDPQIKFSVFFVSMMPRSDRHL
jgi:hypothetical protein